MSQFHSSKSAGKYIQILSRFWMLLWIKSVRLNRLGMKKSILVVDLDYFKNEVSMIQSFRVYLKHSENKSYQNTFCSSLIELIFKKYGRVFGIFIKIWQVSMEIFRHRWNKFRRHCAENLDIAVLWNWQNQQISINLTIFSYTIVSKYM